MAEHFRGRNHTVHFGNGCTGELLRAWLLLAEDHGASAEMDAVRAYFQACLSRDPARPVSRLETIDPPPPELASPGRLRAFATLVAAFAGALAAPPVDPHLTTLEWDRELRIEWISRMHQLYGIIDDALAAEYGQRLPPFDLPLPPEERAACELFRLLAVKRETRQRSGGRIDPVIYAPLMAEIDRLALACPWLSNSTAILTSQRFERILYWLGEGDIERASAAYHEYMAVEESAEMCENARMIWTFETDAPLPAES